MYRQGRKPLLFYFNISPSPFFPFTVHHKITPTPSHPILLFLQITPPPSHQSDSSPQEGLKRRNHSVCRSEPGDVPPLPIFLQQGSAFPQIPQLAGTSPIDTYARVLFPLAFALFNLIYWPLVLSL